MVVSTVFLFTSCLKDDETTTTYPSDAAITGFTLGNLKRYTTTTSSTGTTSTTTTTVAGSTYKFYIDQVNKLIYNPDSLPYGVDAKHVVCTITSKNSGVITIKSMVSDTLRYYNKEDSIDFSVPRIVQVNSLDGKSRARYTVQVNVHKEKADTFLWSNMVTMRPFAEAHNMKAVSLGDKVYVFVSDGSICHVYSSPDGDDKEWMLENLDRPLPASAWKNVVTMGKYMYAYADGRIMRSTNGHDWTAGASASISQLVAAGSRTLYAYGLDGSLLASDDEGAIWLPEKIDDETELLPTNELSYSMVPSSVNEDVETVTIIGNRSVSEYDTEKTAHVWSKVEDPLDDKHEDSWMYITDRDMPTWGLPRLASLTVISYDKGLLATGGEGLGGCTAKPFQHFYYSNNGGIYWVESNVYKIPQGLDSNDVFTMAADSSNRLWLICGGTGEVWRGRMSGAKNEVQTSYTH